MTQAIILTQTRSLRMEPSMFSVSLATLPFIIKAMEDNKYMRSAYINVPESISIEDIPEEMFDLTNNPSRQDEREEKYGNGPSLSCGDVVIVIGHGGWVCMPFGWIKLPQ